MEKVAGWLEHPAVSGGLGILEKSLRGKHVNRLDWINVASATVLSETGTGTYMDGTGGTKWGNIAGQAMFVGAVGYMIGQSKGDAAMTNYIGTQWGQIAKNAIGEYYQYQNATQYLTQDELNTAFGDESTGLSRPVSQCLGQ